MEQALNATFLYTATETWTQVNTTLYYVTTTRRRYIQVATICLFSTSPPLHVLLLKIFYIYINPAISVLGFCANMMSVAILRRSGLGKPSNVLLLGLVIADSMVQLMTMNFAEILEYFDPNMTYPQLCGWQYSPAVNYLMMVIFAVFTFLSTWGQYVNTTLPVIITLERILAVFMPITFKKLVTTRSATVRVVVSFAIWLPWTVYMTAMCDVYIQLSKVMFLELNSDRMGDKAVFDLFYYYISDILSSWVPISLVILGCTLIALKVKKTLDERRRLTSKVDNVKWSSKTTRTLMITCVIFTITHITYSFMNYFYLQRPDALYYLMNALMNLSLLINASSNFFVYIASNRKLYNIFKEIVGIKTMEGRTKKKYF